MLWWRAFEKKSGKGENVCYPFAPSPTMFSTVSKTNFIIFAPSTLPTTGAWNLDQSTMVI